MGDSVTKSKKNVPAAKLIEIVDIPRTQKIAIFGRGSLLGEEDLLKRREYSCSVKCVSGKGILY